MAHAQGLPSRLASQALLHPTGKPVESRGPTSGAGHTGPRSTGHEATEQFVAEGIIAIGRLYPHKRDTAGRNPHHETLQVARTVVKSRFPLPCNIHSATVTSGTPCTTAQYVVSFGGGGEQGQRTAQDWKSHSRPLLHPPWGRRSD